MTAQELSVSTCYATAGLGVKFTWLLAGQDTTYADATGVTIATDGYKVTAALTWQTLSNTNGFNTGATTGSNETPGDAVHMTIGGCVETLDGSSVALATGVTTEGNYAICHWLFFVAVSGNVPVLTLAGATSGYGTTRFLSETQWGTAGNAVTGAGAISSGGGTELTATTNGLTYSPVLSSTFTAFTAVDYTMWWYQPTYSSSYTAGTLRRYNGGSSDGSKVKGYCVSQRMATSTESTHIPGGFTAGTTVTLAGASAMAAGAIALGAAALAF